MLRNRILIIDDHEAVDSHIRRVLNNAGYEIKTVSRDQTALQVIRQNRPDLLMVTDRFRGGDRFDMVRVIRNDPTLYQLPIIVIGTTFDPDEATTALENGADEYLIRSIKPPELIARVRTILRRCYPQADQSAQPVVTETNLFDPIKVVTLNDDRLASELKLNLWLISLALIGVSLIVGLILWLIF